MFALFLMCRKAILGILLAAFAISCAHAAQSSAPVKTRRQSSAATSKHGVHRGTASRKKAHPASAQTRARHQAAATRSSSSSKAGRTAGLAIRRQLAQKRVVSRTIALRRERSQSISRTTVERPSHAQGEPQADAPMEASASLLFLPGTSDAKPTVPLEPATPEKNVKAEKASLRISRSAMPAPLRGSRESLERQNERLDADGLERIQDEADLGDRIEHHLLVPIPASSALLVNAELPDQHRYCRQWTAQFLADLARAHDAAFHRPFEVSSAVRTIEYQKRLMRINGNAAGAEGEIVSPHLTGATIDIAKSGMSRAEIGWMRQRLQALQTAGNIDVEEEFRQACFHITVYKSYMPAPATNPTRRVRNGSAAGKHHKEAVIAVAADTEGF